MKKFSFSLDKVLDYKIQIEDNLRNEHAGAVRAVINKEEEIENMEATHYGYMQDMEDVKLHGCRVQELLIYEGYLQKSKMKIEEQKEVLEHLKHQEEKKRNQVIEAKRERTSIDMLKEKKQSEYDFLVQKDEEKFIEEFVANSRAHGK